VRPVLLAALCAALWLLPATAPAAWAQTGRGANDAAGEEPETPIPETPAGAETKGPIERMTIPTPIVQAGPVDANRYVLGPGDVLELDLWGSLSRTVPLVVTPEGTIFLPSAGPIFVAGRTLAWSRDQVLRQVAQTFRGVHADLRLIQLRNFKVYLTGFVKRPGAVQVTSVTRASEVLNDAGLDEHASHRNILINRHDGNVLRVDLELLRAAGRQDLDPVLIDGDVIMVPRATEFATVTGPVARSGEFELAPGDSLSTLLELAGGPLPAAVLDHVLMVRFATESRRESLWVDLEHVGAAANNFPLRDGDRLFVQYRPEYHVLPSVAIYGEVERPGTYPITIGVDRLSDLLRWTGGFRPLANRSAVLLLRDTEGTKEKDLEFDRLVRLSRSEMTESEYAKFQTKLAERKNSFRIDWSRVQREGTDVDPLLQDLDVVRVDQLVTTVRVEGEVKRPGFVDYLPGRSLREYVDLSGGYTDRAARSGVKISRSLTGQVIPARSLKSIQPGDFIWVPERKDVDAWAVFRDVVTVAGQIAVLIFTLTR
jgi:protein involved in polysaccharide export with SLBB domain